MADVSYETFNVGSVKLHQAIHNNAVYTPATSVTFIHQITQLSEIPVILLPTIKFTNHHGRTCIQRVLWGIIHRAGGRCLGSVTSI